jgi:hypothetical protein
MSKIKKYENFKGEDNSPFLNEEGELDYIYSSDQPSKISRFNDANPAIELEEQSEKEREEEGLYMVETNLEKIMNAAHEIKRKLKMGFDLDEWAKDHLSTSADDIQEVLDYLNR